MLKVELEDETSRLCDVRPFQPMLKLVEKQTNGVQQEKAVLNQITLLVEKRKYCSCFRNRAHCSPTVGVHNCRVGTLNICQPDRDQRPSVAVSDWHYCLNSRQMHNL